MFKGITVSWSWLDFGWSEGEDLVWAWGSAGDWC